MILSYSSSNKQATWIMSRCCCVTSDLSSSIFEVVPHSLLCMNKDADDERRQAESSLLTARRMASQSRRLSCSCHKPEPNSTDFKAKKWENIHASSSHSFFVCVSMWSGSSCSADGRPTRVNLEIWTFLNAQYTNERTKRKIIRLSCSVLPKFASSDKRRK